MSPAGTALAAVALRADLRPVHATLAETIPPRFVLERLRARRSTRGGHLSAAGGAW